MPLFPYTGFWLDRVPALPYDTTVILIVSTVVALSDRDYVPFFTWSVSWDRRLDHHYAALILTKDSIFATQWWLWGPGVVPVRLEVLILWNRGYALSRLPVFYATQSWKNNFFSDAAVSSFESSNLSLNHGRGKQIAVELIADIIVIVNSIPTKALDFLSRRNVKFRKKREKVSEMEICRLLIIQYND